MLLVFCQQAQVGHFTGVTRAQDDKPGGAAQQHTRVASPMPGLMRLISLMPWALGRPADTRVSAPLNGRCRLPAQRGRRRLGRGGLRPALGG